MGNEFSHGDLLSDVLLRTVCQINIQNNFQREKIIIILKKQRGRYKTKYRPLLGRTTGDGDNWLNLMLDTGGLFE